MIKREFFKDNHVIFVVTHLCKSAIILSLNNILETVIKRHPDTILVIIDSRSSDEIRDYLETIKHERVIIDYLDQNIGKARAANGFIAKYINNNNLPKTVWTIDPDLLFYAASFDHLLEAIQNIDKKIGVLGMRYKKNECNPEINMWLPPKKIKGKNGKIYSVTFPFFCNVAGGILAMKGETLRDGLNFVLWPKKFDRVYGGDDSAIYLELKRQGYKMGYLNGTIVTHLKSGNKLAPEIKDMV